MRTAFVSIAAVAVVVEGAVDSNVSSSPTPGVLCGGAQVVAPSGDWLWSHAAVPSPSCTSPSVQNIAEMCAGDPTSVVIRASGQPQCLSAQMPDCKFNMHDISQLDFDINMINCGGTWAAPLWMTPDTWEGGGGSGEIDMLENCPVESVNMNFAGGGHQVRVVIADPNSFQGHLTMWKDASGFVQVQTCDPSALVGGSCPRSGEMASYPNIFSANGCSKYDCTYTLISDIWNGLAGDGGYQGCAHGQTHYSSGCHTSVGNIRFKSSAGTFQGKCAAMNGGAPSPSPTRRRTPSPTRRRTPSPSPSWVPCSGGVCCNPHTTIPQYCPGNIRCQECGGGDACQCPSGAEESVVV